MRPSIAPVFPLLLAALGSVLLSSCGRNQDAQAGAAPASDIPTVAVARAATANLSRDLILTAEFKPYQEVDVMAKVSGYVKEIRVDVGDRSAGGVTRFDETVAEGAATPRGTGGRRRWRLAVATGAGLLALAAAAGVVVRDP